MINGVRRDVVINAIRQRKLRIVENAGGTWHYHLMRDHDLTLPALCGQRFIMLCHVGPEAWGHVSEHIGERYCRRCQELAMLSMESNDDRCLDLCMGMDP